MKRFVRFYQQWSIRTQFLFFFSVMLVFCILLCLQLTQTTHRVFRKNSADYVATISGEMKNDLVHAANQVSNAINYLKQDSDIQDILYLPYSKYSSELLNALQTKIVYTKHLISSIRCITLTSDTVHLSELYTYQDQDEIRQRAKADGTMTSLGIKGATLYAKREQKHLVLGSKVYNTQFSEQLFTPIGAVYISIDIEKFIPDANHLELPYVTYFLVDEDTDVMPLNCSAEKARALLVLCEIDSIEENDRTIQTSAYTLSISPIPSIGLFLISAVDNEALDRSLYGMVYTIWGFVMVILGFFLLLIIAELHNLIRPLQKLSDAIAKEKEATLPDSHPPLVLSGCREITSIGTEFSDMVRTSKHLNQELLTMTTNLYEMKLQKQQADMAFLQSQTNPHFLFNTLEMMRGIAIENNERDIADICQQMGMLMRYSIKGDTIVPLRDEVAVMQAYLNIQKLRFRGKLFAFESFPEEIMDTPIIKMMLQPIVENAVIHGLENRLKEGSIYIGAQRHGDVLEISVVDDGGGIAPEPLFKLQEQLKNNAPWTANEHIGLCNTNTRIRMRYGQQYGIHINSETGLGTKVIICIPLNPSTSKEEDV